MLEILFSVLLFGATASAPDTLFQAREGDQLLIRDFSGAVEVEAWDRDEILAQTDSEGALRFRATRSGRRLELEVLDRKSRNRSVELRLRVPSWIDLDISGPKVDVEVNGMRSQVRIRNLKGDLILEDLVGDVNASSVEGSIDAYGLEGKATLKTGDDDITVHDSNADLELETISGDIRFLSVAAPSIEVRTTDGDLDFEGRFFSGGVYSFRSHGGEINLILDPPVDASVTVLVYEGEFESDFPIKTRGFRSGQDFQFTIGGGGARVLLEAFDGEVTLRRGGLDG